MKDLNVIQQYKKGEEGNFSVIAAGCFASIILMCGAAIDLARGQHAEAKAQMIADSIALSAAVYVDQNGGPPQNDTYGFTHNTVYQAGNYGYEIYGSDNATFKVNYDDIAGEVTVQMDGHMPTAFMKIAQYESMPFRTTSVVKYRETDYGDPASIMFVLDNSGSMWFDDKAVDPDTGVRPADAVRRIDALKSNMQTLNSRLQDIESQPGEVKFLRTGMIPYNDQILSNNKVDMHWGALTSGNINAMTPGGSTNSSPPMQEAWNQLLNEESHHDNESGKDPLKYVIFMTDGKNTNGTDIWVPEEGTNHWRREYEQTHCWYNRRGRKKCRQITREEFFPTDGPSPTPIPAPTDHSDWVEGKYVLNWDYYTQMTCNNLHEEGVKVYTIGFALKEGTYYTNEWGQSLGSEYHYREIDT